MADVTGVASLADQGRPVRNNDILMGKAISDAQALIDRHCTQGEDGVILEVHVSSTEAAVALVIGKGKTALDAIASMRQVSALSPHSGIKDQEKAATSDHADGIAGLMRRVADEALARCDGVPEADPRLLAARSMLKSYRDRLWKVDVQRNSAPAVGLTKLFVMCAHNLMHYNTPPEARQQAVNYWRDNAASVQATGFVLQRQR